MTQDLTIDRTSTRGADWTAVRRALPALCCGVLLAVIAGAIYLRDLDDPRGPVWDESYYLTAVARYAERTPQFASHPPLGLMLMAAGEIASGANRHLDQRALAEHKSVAPGDIPRGYSFRSVRVSSALFAVGIVLGVYLLLLAAVENALLAGSTAALVALETAFVAQFRAAQLDAFQIAFALAALGCVLAAAKTTGARRGAWLAASGAFVGAAAMVKLDGVLLATATGVLIVRDLLAAWRRPGAWIRGVVSGGAVLAAALGVVFAVYSVQLVWCRKPLDYGAPAAAIDARFVSRPLQLYLDGRRELSPAIVLAAVRDSTRFMLNDQRGVARLDPNGSSVWLQPFGLRPITYRWETEGRFTRYVQLLPNPVNWALSALSLIAAAIWLFVRRSGSEARAPEAGVRRDLLVVLFASSTVIYLAHGALGAARVMYLYHDFMPFLFGLLCLPLLVEEAAQARPAWRPRLEAGLILLAVASAAAFAWWSPLALHRPLTPEACARRAHPIPVIQCRG